MRKLYYYGYRSQRRKSYVFLAYVFHLSYRVVGSLCMNWNIFTYVRIDLTNFYHTPQPHLIFCYQLLDWDLNWKWNDLMRSLLGKNFLKSLLFCCLTIDICCRAVRLESVFVTEILHFWVLIEDLPCVIFWMSY